MIRPWLLVKTVIDGREMKACVNMQTVRYFYPAEKDVIFQFQEGEVLRALDTTIEDVMHPPVWKDKV